MIEERLSEANEAVRASTRDVAATLPVDRSSGRTPLIVVFAALAVAVVGTALFVQQNAGDEVAIESAADSSQDASTTTIDAATTTETIADTTTVETPPPDGQTADTPEPDPEAFGGGIAAYLTDGAPPDIGLVDTQSAADFDEPLDVVRSLMYGPGDVTTPSVGDDVIFVNWSVGTPSELFGEPIGVRGSEGVSQTIAVGFHEAGHNVWISSSAVPTTELAAIAEDLQIDADGVVATENLRDLQLRHAGESHFYSADGATVPPGGHTASYGAGLRNFQIFVEPFDGDEAAVAWSIGAAAELQVGPRTVLLQSTETSFGGTSITAVWIEGDVVIRILALEVTEPEVVAIIEGVRPANPSEW